MNSKYMKTWKFSYHYISDPEPETLDGMSRKINTGRKERVIMLCTNEVSKGFGKGTLSKDVRAKSPMADIFTKVNGVVAFKGNADQGGYSINPNLTLVNSSTGILRFKATPWGAGVLDLRVIYDSNLRTGCYSLTPRFLFHGVEMGISYPAVQAYALAISVFNDVDVVDMLGIIQESIKASTITFEMGDEDLGESTKDFTLRFRDTIISRVYDNTGNIRYKVVDMATSKILVGYRIYLNTFERDGAVTLRHDSTGNNVTIKCDVTIPVAY